MFLNLLEKEEKMAFAVLAERMIQTDGIVVGSEAVAIAALKGEMGIESADAGGRAVEELAAVFASRRSKVAALLELIGLGYSDTSFHVTERSLVWKAAAEMGISADELAHLEGWVQKYVELVRQGMVFMRE
jgi:uncharacterized tellurite resistance protein B-like protein